MLKIVIIFLHVLLAADCCLAAIRTNTDFQTVPIILLTAKGEEND